MRDENEDVNAQVESWTPGKRNRRVNSLPVSSKISREIRELSISTKGKTKAQRQTQPGKRKRRVDSTPASQITIAETDDPLSKLVTINCKLTNEVLITKNKLHEKMDAFMKLQENYYQKTIECKELTSKVKELQKCVEQLKSERFTDDLIDFENNSPGKFTYWTFFKLGLAHSFIFYRRRK